MGILAQDGNSGSGSISQSGYYYQREIASTYHKDTENYDGTGEQLEFKDDQVTDYVRTPAGWKMVAKTFLLMLYKNHRNSVYCTALCASN
ncbi:MAG: hypothetical protein HRT52_05115 [Colwellia sp.]|nr:hypothetical protein [Colwellia sp.]